MKTIITRKFDDGTITYEIKEHIGTLQHEDDWNKEVNIAAWNGGEPKIDIRSWSDDHKHMSRGITLTEEEAWKLASLIIYRKGYQIVDDDLNVI